MDVIDFDACGPAMHRLAARLFPICRSITGRGLRETLAIIADEIPLQTTEVPTGTQVFDWIVPREWNIREAWVEDGGGRRIIDFADTNLHVVGYSVPVDAVVSLGELQEHLHSLPSRPDAVPYVTSYYEERWGFCVAHRRRLELADEVYRVHIDSDLTDGALTFGEVIIPGELDEEVFLSTYVCHPSMANNELSGPVVATYLVKWLLTQRRRYSYRVVFVPETIGSLTYLSRNLDAMRRNVVAGFNLTCLGDERGFSFLPSRHGRTLADRAALNVLRHEHPEFVHYSFLDRGSDERQYCGPGVDLPVVSVMRSKYLTYPEYHTSQDDLSLVTPAGLQGGFDALRACLDLLEHNRVYHTTCLGEPQLGRRGLYPTLSTRESSRQVQDMMNLLAYADGTGDLIEISDRIGVPARRLCPLAEMLEGAGLLTVLHR